MDRNLCVDTHCSNPDIVETACRLGKHYRKAAKSWGKKVSLLGLSADKQFPGLAGSKRGIPIRWEE